MGVGDREGQGVRERHTEIERERERERERESHERFGKSGGRHTGSRKTHQLTRNRELLRTALLEFF